MENKDDYIKLLENTLMKSVDNVAQLKNELNQDFDYYDYVCELGMNNIQALDFLDLFSDDTIYIQAKKDYLGLKEIVNNHKGTLEELHEELGGHNYDSNGKEEYDECITIDYKSICITILTKDNKIFLDNHLNIYDRDGNEYESGLDIKELLEYGNEE